MGSAGGQLSGTGPVRLALGQAVAELGALGGMIHVRDPLGGVMRLVASMGLPDNLVAGWETLTDEDSAAPVSCVRYGTHVWTPPPPDVPQRAPLSSSGRSSRGDFPPGAGSLPPGSGVVSMPVITGGGQPVGALSALLEAPDELGDAQCEFLRMVADWVAEYLRPARPAATDVEHERQPLGGDAVGSAVWRMTDGLLALDDQARLTFANPAALKLLGSSAHEALGTVLWDHPVVRDTGMAACHGRAVTTHAPAGFDTRWPGRPGWYHARFDPAPDGLVIHISDITERRREEAEQSAAQRTAAERVMRMGELTSALAEALTVQDVVKAVADRMLPPFGATGLICGLIETARLRIVGSAGYPEEFLEIVQKMMVSEMSAVVQVLSSRTPTFLSTPQEYAEQHPDAVGYLHRSGMKAWAFLPLIASDQQIGYCVVSFSRPRHFSEEDRSLLIALSGLVAQALERARLYDAEHTRAQELQRGLLPRTLPVVPAVVAEARYLPATEGVQVGGDWYDLIPLSGERVALVIGDVMGHGLSEAATMGRLRTAVHTLADLEFPPDELLTHLNDLVGDLGDDFYATCLYTVYDPVTNRCAFASAGHPPVAIVHPDGTAHFPHVDADPPLGAASPPFETHEVQVPEGSHLVLYTDGLVESSTVDIDEGMARLAQALTRAAAPPCRIARGRVRTHLRAHHAARSRPTVRRSRQRAGAGAGRDPRRRRAADRPDAVDGPRPGGVVGTAGRPHLRGRSPPPCHRAAVRVASRRADDDDGAPGQRAGRQCRPARQGPSAAAPAVRPDADLRGLRPQPHHPSDPPGRRDRRGRARAAAGRGAVRSVGHAVLGDGQVHLDGAGTALARPPGRRLRGRGPRCARRCGPPPARSRIGR
ncbi:hypothetical protein GCM10022420_053900 [Streptomyces iranensis]